MISWIKKLFAAFALVPFVIWFLASSITWYYLFLKDTKTTNTSSSTQETATVSKRDMQESISTTGDASLIDEQSLRFTMEWTVTAVYFTAGDEVKEGDIIAEIDNSDGERNVEEAQMSFNEASLDLQDLYDDPNESDILSAENNILSAQNSLDNAKTELENLKVSQTNTLSNLEKSLEVSQKDLETQQSSYELAKQELDLAIAQNEDSLNSTTSNKNTTLLSLESNLSTYKLEAENMLEDVDVIFWITNENKKKNDDYEQFLAAKDSTSKSKTRSAFLDASALLETFTQDLDAYSGDGDKDTLLDLYTQAQVLFQKLYEMTDYAYTAVDASIISAGSLTQSSVDSMKSEMNSDRTSALSKVSSINSNMNTLNTLTDTDLTVTADDIEIQNKQQSLISSQISIEKAQNSIQSAKENIEETKADQELALLSKQQDITAKENSLKLAQLKYDELMEGPTDMEVQKAKNTLTQAQLKLESAQEALDDYKIIAPFDGVVKTIDYQVGDKLTSDTDEYVYIENPNLLVISVYLDQIDIMSVKEWMDATVTFDTYSTTAVNAKVSSVDTTPTESSGVVSYEVQVVLDDSSFWDEVLSGMTADVEIIIASETDVLAVKTSAITENDDGTYTVEKVGSNDQTETVEVVVGIAADGYTEILSGLDEGDEIILSTYTASATSTDTSSSTSLFWGGGGGWWMWGGPSGGGPGF